MSDNPWRALATAMLFLVLVGVVVIGAGFLAAG